jgi:hypothetical protein
MLSILFFAIICFYIILPHILHSSISAFYSFEQTHTRQLSNLQWCKKNPFFKGFDERLLIEIEKNWYRWSQDQLSRTFKFLKTYAESSGKTVAEFTQILYPTTELLFCPYNNNSMKRYGGAGDLGKLLCGVETILLDDTCIVYSLGSQSHFEFEEAILSETRCTVHTFDCTSSPPQQKINRLHFHKICLGENSPLQHFLYPLAGKNMNDSSFQSLYMKFNQILEMLKHSTVHILKMDIEGAEYSVFVDLLQNSSGLSLPYQITFESHWWNRDIYHAILHISLFSQLWKSGYRLLSYEANELDRSCVEWTFMRMFC